MAIVQNWFFWALLAAIFAALTSIFAKVGLEGVDSDYATLLRTFVVIVILGGFIYFSDKWTNPIKLSSKTLLFLTLSALATGASWICYFRALKIGEAYKVAPIDKLSIVIVTIFAVLFLNEKPSMRDWTGIFAISFGIILLALKR